MYSNYRKTTSCFHEQVLKEECKKTTRHRKSMMSKTNFNVSSEFVLQVVIPVGATTKQNKWMTKHKR